MLSFWDRFAGLYDIAELANKRVNDTNAQKAACEIRKGDYVLDCAAGTGAFSAAAAENAGHVLCTDFSKKMLICSMKRAKRLGITNISFAKRDILALKDGDGIFDAVIAGNVIHLVNDPEKAVSELIRVTKKGGRIIIPTYLNGNFKGIGKPMIKLYKLAGFAPHTEFTLESYTDFIAGAAEKHGCLYKIELINGNMPAGFAVINKPKGGL